MKKTTLKSIPLHEVAKFDAATMRDTPSYAASPEDWAMSRLIMDRIMEIALANGFDEINRQALHQDLMTAHCNATPLHLFGLLISSNDAFTHDVLGIGLHIDRSNGKFFNGFHPRFAINSA